MKRSDLYLVMAFCLAAMAGCQSAPKPSPGMASLRVKLIAEPKQGFADDRPSMYDYGGAGPRDLGKGAFELVDYAELGDIVVWAEPRSGGGGGKSMGALNIDVNARKPTGGLA